MKSHQPMQMKSPRTSNFVIRISPPRVALALAAAVLASCMLAPSPAAAAESCESLSSLKLPDTTITLAESVAAGAFKLPSSNAAGAPSQEFKTLPAFCRVTAEIQPSTDSHIKIEVWMPLAGWNGKFAGAGNGGFAGYINYSDMAAALNHSFATASTDTGHLAGGTDASWALGHPEKAIDFGYRAIHLMTSGAQAITAAFYNGKVRRSYFSSCSNGGRQALMEAQRFPQDYDGIIAGAPANYWTHLLATSIWNVQATQSDPSSYIPAEKIPAIGKAVLESCDRQDGVADGIINDPPRCAFQPQKLLCNGADSPACLTAPQVAALRKIYSGPHTSQNVQIFPGFSVGGEDGPGGWSLWVTGTAPGKGLQFLFGNGFFSNFVAADHAWDFRTFNFDTDVKPLDEKFAPIFNATNPNLKAFKSRGGKLILYHGWSDAAIPPLNSIDYFNSVVAAMGADNAQDFVRLYMVPGMQHCDGGPGADAFGAGYDSPVPADPQHNLELALEQWVEKHVAPGKIIATNYKNQLDPTQGVKITRPLCPFPQRAVYAQKGDTSDAASFACAAPEAVTPRK